jgi:Tfp pilus assembly protein PilF
MVTSRRNMRQRMGAGRIERAVSPAAQSEHPLPPPGDPADRWRDFAMRAAVIVLAALFIYSPVYHPFFPADWLWDDDQLLTANATVQSTTPGALAKLWFNPDGADYFPLSYTALWLQWAFFGMWPTGYHLTTVVLHIIGALLVWRLFAVMRIPGAWLGGVLFAVHPVCVESVAWVSELKNTLSLPLFLLSAIHFIQADEAEPDSPVATKHYVISMVTFLLSMFAKTSIVAMPVVLLLYAWWKRGRITERDLVRSAPYFAISVILGIITIYYQHGRAIGQETIIVGGPDSRIATAGMSILFYLKLIFWPVHLLPIYTKWEVDPPKVWQFLPWPVIAAAGWWCWQNRATWGRHVILGLGFFLLMVAPVLGFITISYMRITWAADHFIYLPMIGVIGLVAAGIATWYDRLPDAERPLLVAGTSVVLALLTWMSFGYAGCWVNEDALWTHTLMYNENAWQAHNRLGAKKFSRGHVDDIPAGARGGQFSTGLRRDIENRGALHHFTRSTALRPDLGETHNNLGTALSAKGRINEAIEQFKEACRVTPHVPAIHVNLANALAAASRFPEAERKYAELIGQIEKQHAEMVQRTGNPALPIDPGIAALINNYGVTLFKQDKKEEAIAAFRRALSINPNLKDARESLAVATGEKPEPEKPAGPPPAGGQLQMQLPTSPTLGPAP